MTQAPTTDDGYEAQRQRMVERQLRPRGIRDPRVLQAMRDVPRHCFVPEYMRDASYEDCAWPIGDGQTISQPYLVARICELAELAPHERALEIGAGSGYEAAVLSQLCKQVIGIELVESLAAGAQQRLSELGMTNVSIIAGDGRRGHAAQAPYDAIVVAASVPEIPEVWVEQLALGGRLVLPIGTPALQVLTVLRKTKQGLQQQCHQHCAFQPLHREREPRTLPLFY